MSYIDIFNDRVAMLEDYFKSSELQNDEHEHPTSFTTSLPNFILTVNDSSPFNGSSSRPYYLLQEP